MPTDDVTELAIINGRTEDVAVVARGVHTCMVMRGITTMGMTSSSMRGMFRIEGDLRAEFLTLIQMEAP